MGMTAPSFGAILSSTPFYQNFFSQPVSYTTSVLSQIPQAAPTVENILKADPNLTGYQATPDYGAALSSYMGAIGNDPNYYQSVTNPTEMAQLNNLQRDVADAKTDYWNTALNTSGTPLGPSSEAWKPALNENLGPVGVQDGLPVMSSWGASPIGLYYITKEGNVEYSEPEDTRLSDMFITGVGTLMGGIAGGPALGVAVGAGLGAAAGSVTSDLANDRSIDYLKAGITGLATYGGGTIAPMVTSAVTPALSSVAGQSVGQVAGGAVGGAAGGAVTGATLGGKAALETGSWDPVLYGAGIGGLVGGISGGINAYTNLDGLSASDQYYVDRYLQQNPSPYYDTITGEMIYPASLSTDELLAQAYQAANPGFTPFTVDPLLQYVTPADTALQGTLENSNALGTTDPEALADKYYTERYLQQNPSPYYDPITQQMITPPGLTADEALVQDYTKANPTPDVRYQEPSIMGEVGKAVLDNKKLLGELAKLLMGGGAATGAGAFPDGGGRPGMSSPDAVTEFLMQHGGTGKGKSKGLGAGEVKGPYYGDSFMPGLKEIKKYDEQGLYYT